MFNNTKLIKIHCSKSILSKYFLGRYIVTILGQAAQKQQRQRDPNR